MKINVDLSNTELSFVLNTFKSVAEENAQLKVDLQEVKDNCNEKINQNWESKRKIERLETDLASSRQEVESLRLRHPAADLKAALVVETFKAGCGYHHDTSPNNTNEPSPAPAAARMRDYFLLVGGSLALLFRAGDLAASGQNILAIKLVREATDADLRAAKDFVELHKF